MKTKSIQTGINQYTNEQLGQYSMFVGGLNATNSALAQWDPQKTGYGRLFMIHKPTFMTQCMSSELNTFKHILEYGNTNISGLNDITMNFNSLTGGYTGKSFEIPSYAQDDTNSITVTCYELSGSPIRSVIYSWLNGISDFNHGLAHYNGVNLPVKQSNHSAEFVYLTTDSSGKNIEYACLLTNCVPKNVKLDQYNYSSGTHDLVEYQIEFTCNRYHSLQINKLAADLLKTYSIMYNSLNFHSGYNSSTTDDSLKVTAINGTTKQESTNNRIVYDSRDGTLSAYKNVVSSYDTKYGVAGALKKQLKGETL